MAARAPRLGGGGCSSPARREPARGARARAGCSSVRSSLGGTALRWPGTLSTLGTPGRIPLRRALHPPVGQRGVGPTYAAHGVAFDHGVEDHAVLVARLRDDV